MKMRQRVRYTLILISFLLFPITIFYLSPYLIVKGSSEGIITGSFIIFSLMFLFSMFFGRLFCGWICPSGGLQEAFFRANKNRVSQKYNWVKFLIWGPWIILIIYMVFSAGGYKSVNFFYQTTNGISVAAPSAYFVFYSVIGLIVILALIFGRRSFCHYVCWMAPFMILGNKLGKILKIPSLSLKSDKKKCINCMACTENCPMSLDVNKMVQNETMKNSECILCGKCIDNCPKDVINYGFK